MQKFVVVRIDVSQEGVISVQTNKKLFDSIAHFETEFLEECSNAEINIKASDLIYRFLEGDVYDISTVTEMQISISGQQTTFNLTKVEV